MSRRLLVLVFSVALAFTALSGSSSYAQLDPPGVNPSHYWTYQPAYAHYQPEQIFARDQFFPGFVPIYLDSLTRWVNWVHKNGSPVPDTLIHYTWWNIKNKLPNFSSAIITNQFGQYPINVYDLDFMLVPAWKNEPRPDNPQANHYLCYKAQGPPPPPIPYQFQDEWRYDVQPVGPLQFLCAPCWKDHAGIIYPPVDTLTHLALYPIYPHSEWFYPYLQDQFFAGYCQVRQQPIEYLMVPTLKQLIPTKSKDSTWGKLKSIYR